MLAKNINKDIRESFNLINKYRILFTAFCLSIPVYLINFTTNANSFMFAGYSLYFLALIANVKQIRFDQAFGKLVLFLCFFLFLWMFPSVYIVFFSGRLESETINLWGLASRGFFFTSIIIALYPYCTRNKQNDLTKLYQSLILCLIFFMIVLIGHILIKYIDTENFRLSFRRISPLNFEANTSSLYIFVVILLLQTLHLKILKWLLTALLIFIMVGATHSRGNFIGCIIALTIINGPCLYGYLRKIVENKTKLIISLSVVLAMMFYYSEIANFISQLLSLDNPARSFEGGLTGRYTRWQTFFEIGQMHPWQGMGHAYTLLNYQGNDAAHNMFLRIFVENGLGLMLLILLMCVVVFAKLLQKRLYLDLGYFCGIMFIYQFENYSVNLFLPNIILYVVMLRAFFFKAR